MADNKEPWLPVQSLASLSGLRIEHCCELWCRPTATAPMIRSLEPPCAMGATQERKKRQKKKKKNLKFPPTSLFYGCIVFIPRGIYKILAANFTLILGVTLIPFFDPISLSLSI